MEKWNGEKSNRSRKKRLTTNGKVEIANQKPMLKEYRKKKQQQENKNNNENKEELNPIFS